MTATGLNCGSGVTIHPATLKAVTGAARHRGVAILEQHQQPPQHNQQIII